MSAIAVGQVLALYTWFPLIALVYMMMLIARFYERSFGQGTYFKLYVIPMVCFGGGAVRYAGIEQLSGDWWGDGFILAGGIVLGVLSSRLYWQMMHAPQRQG